MPEMKLAAPHKDTKNYQEILPNIRANFRKGLFTYFSGDASDKQLGRKLIEYIISGNQDKAKELLTLHPHLASQRHTFTDWSGRTFKNCSLFQFILWGLDVRYMGNMVLDCLPENEEGEAIRIKLMEQAQELETQGLTYTFKHKTYREKHFSFEPIKSSLNTYVENHATWTRAERVHHCHKVIGKEQAMLPTHVRQHYCDPKVPFYPTPKFTQEKFTRSLNFYNVLRKKFEVWDNKLEGLGTQFSMSRWSHTECNAGCDVLRRVYETDLMALSTLEKVRTETDLPLLMERLKTPIRKNDLVVTP